MRRRKEKKQKEPSLVRKLIDIHYEQAKRRKAVRIMEKQAWSFDFLSMLLVKAGRQLGDGVQLDITDKNGVKMTLSYSRAVQSDANTALDTDNDIFNRLDDKAAVDDFIRRHSVR